MSFTVLIHTIISSLSWTSFDLSRKGLANRIPANEAVVLLMFAQVPLFGFLAIGESWGISSSNYWPPALASIFLNIFANILFLESLRRAPVSLAIPILSFTPVFSAIGSWLALGETLDTGQIVGILIIVAATFFIQKPDEKVAADTKSSVRLGLVFMLCVSLLWSITPIADKVCLRFSGPATHAALQCFFVGFVLLIRFFRNPEPATNSLWAIAKQHRKLLLLAGASACSALFFQLLAIAAYEVALFEAMKRSLGLMGAIAGGYLFFREPISPRKILGSFGLILGILLVLDLQKNLL